MNVCVPNLRPEFYTLHGLVNLMIERWCLQNKKPVGFCAQELHKTYESEREGNEPFFEVALSLR